MHSYTRPLRAIRSRRGFSVVETAIVLGIAGIILGGIWAYAAAGWDGVKRRQTAEEVTAIVTGVRAAYLSGIGIGGGYTGATAAGGLTQQAAARNAIPSQYIRTTGCTNVGNNDICVDHPWGPTSNSSISTHGSLGICGWGAPASSTICSSGAPSTANQYFAVELQGLSIPDCIALATQLSSPGGPPGLADVVINTSSILGAGTSKTIPVSVADAEHFCNLQAGAPPVSLYMEMIDFVYRLNAPAF